MSDISQPPASPEPGSVAIVKKTPMKSPREIVLEKKLSTLEDEVSGLKTAVTGINDWLAGLGLGGKQAAPAPVPGIAATTAPEKKGFMEGLMDDLMG
jgi:hypothetical protein